MDIESSSDPLEERHSVSTYAYHCSISRVLLYGIFSIVVILYAIRFTLATVTFFQSNDGTLCGEPYPSFPKSTNGLFAYFACNIASSLLWLIYSVITFYRIIKKVDDILPFYGSLNRRELYNVILLIDGNDDHSGIFAMLTILTGFIIGSLSIYVFTWWFLDQGCLLIWFTFGSSLFDPIIFALLLLFTKIIKHNWREFDEWLDG